MPDQFSRRAFLAGALAVGTVSAIGTYFVPGGSQPSQAELRLLTGDDTTGSRNLLIDMWNEANPRTQVKAVSVGSSTSDQLAAMIGEAENGTAAILNIDIIDLPMFKQRSLLEPIELEGRERFLDRTLLPCTLGDGAPNAQLWAAPYNTDVGVLFSRGVQPGPLIQVLDQKGVGSPQLVGQLSPTSDAFAEAFTVNILEQVLWRNDSMLGDGSGLVVGPDRPGLPSTSTDLWQEVLEPVRESILSGAILAGDSEDHTRDQYIHSTMIPYMRNWPVKYREMQRIGEPDALSRRMTVGKLPVGVLGGQCLAVVAESDLRDRAADFIRFMISEDSQRILTAYGVAAAHSAGYSDDLKVFTPHLDDLRGAVQSASLRPIHPGYRRFSNIIYRNVQRFLKDGIKLPGDFGGQLEAALR